MSLLGLAQLLKNKLVGKDKKKKKKRSGSESSDGTDVEGEEGGEAWSSEVKKPMTEFEKLQVGTSMYIGVPSPNLQTHDITPLPVHNICVRRRDVRSYQCSNTVRTS